MVSRSQAKRILNRAERFRTVLLDFEGVERIGQGFADKLFRVFANQHPEVELMPVHAVSQVQSIIDRVHADQMELS